MYFSLLSCSCIVSKQQIIPAHKALTSQGSKDCLHKLNQNGKLLA